MQLPDEERDELSYEVAQLLQEGADVQMVVRILEELVNDFKARDGEGGQNYDEL